MILYHIEQPGWVKSAVSKVVNLLPYRRDIPSRPTGLSRGCTWDKVTYIKYIEGVKARFKVGDLVTYMYTSPSSTVVPHHFKIIYINELAHDVMYDNDLQLPACISVQFGEGTDVKTFVKTPNTLRLLTKEEIALVNLQNTKPLGTC